MQPCTTALVPPPSCCCCCCCSLQALRRELREFVTQTGLPPRTMPSGPQLLEAGRGDLYQVGGQVVDRSSRMLGMQDFLNGMQCIFKTLSACLCLVQAVVGRGGVIATAEALGWQSQRKRRGAWADAAAVAAELRQFILDTQFQEEGGGIQGKGKPRSQQQRRGATAVEQHQPQELPPGARMPSRRELVAAGRHDLRCDTRWCWRIVRL